MELKGKAELLRIFVGEADKLDRQPLYEALVQAARKAGLAGATVTRGVLSYGASSRWHTDKVLDLSSDLPIVIEMVDTAEKIETFLPQLHDLMEQAQSGGLVTLETVHVIKYLRGPGA